MSWGSIARSPGLRLQPRPYVPLQLPLSPGLRLFLRRSPPLLSSSMWAWVISFICLFASRVGPFPAARTRSLLPLLSGAVTFPHGAVVWPRPRSVFPPAASHLRCGDRFPLLPAVSLRAGAAPFRQSPFSLAARRLGCHFVGRSRRAAQVDRTSTSDSALCFATIYHLGGSPTCRTVFLGEGRGSGIRISAYSLEAVGSSALRVLFHRPQATPLTPAHMHD
ncbi:hypothetical protein NDU88_000818 [Pleurodeles waltl]|uniref:Uncharacterized protein n=1 Tax=Pleurodeles waltl TaxID=8319 RepID=A0AAV7SY30_PLEWA|nr:hypothetical protein NDU88_000818 [Pleurodeles waltl]